MSNNELTNFTTGELLPHLPENTPPLRTIEGKRALLEQWQKDKSIIPGVVSARSPEPREFIKARDQLAERKNAILTLAMINNLAPYLNQLDFRAAVIRTAEKLAKAALSTPPGLDLDGSLERNAEWINLLLKKVALRRRAAPSSASRTAVGQDLNSPANAPSSAIPARESKVTGSEVPEPKPGDRPDFLRWWNQSAAIDALLTITAGIRSWDEFIEYLPEARGPLGSGAKWKGTESFIPTGKTPNGENVRIYLHVHPDICQLLALEKDIDKRGGETWSVKLGLHNLAGNSSQGVYKTATGLRVGHLYMITLLEHLRPSTPVARPGQQEHRKTCMAKPFLTEAGEEARRASIQMLIENSSPSQQNGGEVGSFARRFASPEAAERLNATVVSSAQTGCRRLTFEELGFQPAASGMADAPWWADLSIGSICTNPDELNPEQGISLIRLYASLAANGIHDFSIELMDDEHDLLRTHLLLTDPMTLPGVHTAADVPLMMGRIRSAMADACWMVTLEPDYSRVANIGLAIALKR